MNPEEQLTSRRETKYKYLCLFIGKTNINTHRYTHFREISICMIDEVTATAVADCQSVCLSVCLSFIHSFVYCSNILMNMASHNSLLLSILKFYGNRRLVEIALVRKRQTTNSAAVKKLTSSPLALYGVLCGINIYG